MQTSSQLVPLLGVEDPVQLFDMHSSHSQIHKYKNKNTKVCAILTNYLICTVPGATVLAVDPSAELLSKVPTQNIIVILPIVLIHGSFPIIVLYGNPHTRHTFQHT